MTTLLNRAKYKVLPLYTDLQAKNLFGTSRNVIFTEDLLENYFSLEKGSLRGCKITNSIVITSELIRSKKIEMDIMVQLPNGKEINLEFYSYYDKYSETKSFIYISKLFGNQLNVGEKYNKVHEVSQINFIHEDKLRNDNNLIKRYLVMNKDNPSDFILENLFEIDIVNIANTSNLAYNGINEGLADWIRFIGANTYEEMVKLSKKRPILEEALREMERFSNNEDVSCYFTRDILDATRDEAYEEKIEKLNQEQKNFEEEQKNFEEMQKNFEQEQIIFKQKRKKFEQEQEVFKLEIAKNNRREIAKKMLNENLDLCLIMKVTGLTEEEIEKL